MNNIEHVKILVFDKEYQIKVESEEEKKIIKEVSQYIKRKWEESSIKDYDRKKDYIIMEIVAELWQKIKDCEKNEKNVMNTLQRINILLDGFLQDQE